MGRWRIRGAPSMRNVPCPKLTRAVRNRMEVPLLAADKSAVSAGICPPHPRTRIVLCAGSWTTGPPSFAKASAMTRVSSLSRAPVNRDSPSASAAQTIARLVRLFDPGGRIDPWIGPLGRISIVSTIAHLHKADC